MSRSLVVGLVVGAVQYWSTKPLHVDQETEAKGRIEAVKAGCGAWVLHAFFFS